MWVFFQCEWFLKTVAFFELVSLEGVPTELFCIWMSVVYFCNPETSKCSAFLRCMRALLVLWSLWKGRASSQSIPSFFPRSCAVGASSVNVESVHITYHIRNIATSDIFWYFMASVA